MAAQNLAEMQQLGITHVLTLSKDAPPKFPELFCYKIIPVDDLVTTDLGPYWDEIVDFIASNLARGGCVLVHWYVRVFVFVYVCVFVRVRVRVCVRCTCVRVCVCFVRCVLLLFTLY